MFLDEDTVVKLLKIIWAEKEEAFWERKINISIHDGYGDIMNRTVTFCVEGSPNKLWGGFEMLKDRSLRVLSNEGIYTLKLETMVLIKASCYPVLQPLKKSLKTNKMSAYLISTLRDKLHAESIE